LLELVGIAQPQRRARSFPHELCGGERQHVVIAIAIANDPDLLICDEPTTALDITVQAQILEVLKTARRRWGGGVDHLWVVAEFADRALVMYAGKAVETAPVAAAPRRARGWCRSPARHSRWPRCRRVARSRRAVGWPSTPAPGLHRRGQDFARAHEALLTDELASRVRRQSGSVQECKARSMWARSSWFMATAVGMQLTVRNVGRVHKYRCSTCIAGV